MFGPGMIRALNEAGSVSDLIDLIHDEGGYAYDVMGEVESEYVAENLDEIVDTFDLDTDDPELFTKAQQYTFEGQIYDWPMEAVEKMGEALRAELRAVRGLDEDADLPDVEAGQPDDSTESRRWKGGDCGPAAYAALTGVTLEEAERILIDAHEAMGKEQKSGCNMRAMDYALNAAGFEVPPTLSSKAKRLPTDEWHDAGIPLNFGGRRGGWGSHAKNAYTETRYTLARFVREVANEGLWLITVGSSTPHYVVYRDGELVEDNGTPLRRGRVLFAQPVTEPTPTPQSTEEESMEETTKQALRWTDPRMEDASATRALAANLNHSPARTEKLREALLAGLDEPIQLDRFGRAVIMSPETRDRLVALLSELADLYEAGAATEEVEVAPEVSPVSDYTFYTSEEEWKDRSPTRRRRGLTRKVATAEINAVRSLYSAYDVIVARDGQRYQTFTATDPEARDARLAREAADPENTQDEEESMEDTSEGTRYPEFTAPYWKALASARAAETPDWEVSSPNLVAEDYDWEDLSLDARMDQWIVRLPATLTPGSPEDNEAWAHVTKAIEGEFKRGVRKALKLSDGRLPGDEKDVITYDDRTLGEQIVDLTGAPAYSGALDGLYHYVETASGLAKVFSIDKCEKCGGLVQAPNAMTTTRVTARSRGLRELPCALPEIYWEDETGGTACEFCYGQEVASEATTEDGVEEEWIGGQPEDVIGEATTEETEGEETEGEQIAELIGALSEGTGDEDPVAVYVVVVANVALDPLRERLNRNKLSGAAWAVEGFGPWGDEPAVMFRIATSRGEALRQAIQWILVEHDEEAAYWEVDGRPGLLYSYGEITPIVES